MEILEKNSTNHHKLNDYTTILSSDIERAEDNISVLFYYGMLYNSFNESFTPIEESEKYKTPPFCVYSKLYFVTNGSYILKIKDRPLKMERGDMVLIPAGTKAEFFSCNEIFEHYYLHFNVFYRNENILNNFFTDINSNYIVHFDSNNDLSAHFNNLLDYAKQERDQNPVFEFLIKSELMQILSSYIRKANLYH